MFPAKACPTIPPAAAIRLSLFDPAETAPVAKQDSIVVFSDSPAMPPE